MSVLEWDAAVRRTSSIRSDRPTSARFRGPHGDAPQTDVDAADTGALRRCPAADAVPASLLAAHFRLGKPAAAGRDQGRRLVGDATGGFGSGAAGGHRPATMLMDSVTVLLHRLGVAYVGIMNPVLRVQRGPAGDLLDIQPATSGGDATAAATWRPGSTSSWRRRVDRTAVADAERLSRGARRQPAGGTGLRRDERASCMVWPMRSTATTPAGSPGRTAPMSPSLLRWLADGHFVLLGYQRCPVRDGQVVGGRGEPAGCAAAARRGSAAAHRQQRSAGARAGDDPELPALRCLPLHRGGAGADRQARRSSIASSGCSPSRR